MTLQGFLACVAVLQSRVASLLRLACREATITRPPAHHPTSGTAMANLAVMAKFVREGDRGAAGEVIHGRLGLQPGDDWPHANVADVTDLTSKTGEILRGR